MLGRSPDGARPSPPPPRHEGDARAHSVIVPGIGGSGPAHWQSRWEVDAATRDGSRPRRGMSPSSTTGSPRSAAPSATPTPFPCWSRSAWAASRWRTGRCERMTRPSASRAPSSSRRPDPAAPRRREASPCRRRRCRHPRWSSRRRTAASARSTAPPRSPPRGARRCSGSGPAVTSTSRADAASGQRGCSCSRTSSLRREPGFAQAG